MIRSLVVAVLEDVIMIIIIIPAKSARATHAQPNSLSALGQP